MNNVKLHGVTNSLCENIIDRWLLGIRETQPAILDIFKDRNVKPYRDLLPWSGEFAGKYLISAYYVHDITDNKALFDYVRKFIDELISCQDKDGYLGCYSDSCKITGAFSATPEKAGDNWDSWGHYHIMVGLMLWHDKIKDPKIMACIEKIADFYIGNFYDGKKDLSSIGWTEMNLAVYHSFAMLYNTTHEEKYLAFALKIEKDLSSAGAENYLQVGLSGTEFYLCKKPRWESLHVIMGFAEMYRATGDEKYKRAFLSLTDSILKTDVHNTGAFSTNEQAIGNPFSEGAVETCCVVAFNATVFLAWQMEHSVKYIDHLEIAHYNAMLGACSPSGLWSTYDTPMDGSKRANFQDVAFQCRPGSPMLNCCSVNAPRGVSEIGRWIVTKQEDAVFVNSFEDCDYSCGKANIRIRGGYPYNNVIEIKLNNVGCPVKVRVPSWSESTEISFNGKAVKAEKGTYSSVQGDGTLVIKLDFTPGFLNGELRLENKQSLYIGCVLFALDASLNPSFDIKDIRLKRADILGSEPVKRGDTWQLPVANANLVDFYHAGYSGSNYISWLTID